MDSLILIFSQVYYPASQLSQQRPLSFPLADALKRGVSPLAYLLSYWSCLNKFPATLRNNALQ